jgi:hypothetical protein
MDLTVLPNKAFITQNASNERAPMKVLTYSDVHLEFGRNWHPPRNIDGDVMLLAGDITSFKTYKPLKFFLRFWDKPVIYIAGNHEYYGTNMEPAERVAVEWISQKLPNVHYLKNSAVEINGVHFFGGTMWTDFDGNLHCMDFAERSMNDYRQIRTDKTKRLKAEDTLKFHEEFVINLKDWLAQNLKGPRVVISHHAPIEEPAVVRRYYDDYARGDLSRSAYLYQKLVGKLTAVKKRYKTPVKDHAALAQITVWCGQIAQGLRTTSQTVNEGNTVFSEETEALLKQACNDIREIRNAVFKALGFKVEEEE